MRQQQLAGHVADGPDAGHAGGKFFINLNETFAVQLHAGFFQAKTGGIGAETNGYQACSASMDFARVALTLTITPFWIFDSFTCGR